MKNEVLALFRGACVESISLESYGIVIQLTTARLWVDSPWRLEREGSIFLGSGNLEEFLSHEDYASDYEDAEQEIRETLSGIISDALFHDYNEICLHFENGTLFRTFQNYGPDAENFQLTTSEGRFLVNPDGIEFERKRDS